MSNIENLINKILEDGEKEANSIVQAAEEAGEELIKAKKVEAERLKGKIIERAEQEGKRKAERVVSSAELEIRNNKLMAKHQVIDRVLNEALQELANISMDKYLKLLRDFVNNMDLEGNLEIVVPEKFKDEKLDDFIDELNNTMTINKRNLYFTLAGDYRNINSGFIFIREGIEINNTFEAVVSSLRDELEHQVAERLFKEH